MKKIRKDQVLAALVRTFFKYFLTGIMEGSDIADTRAVKQALLEYYEEVSRIYNQEAFYAIARMNYDSIGIETVLRNHPTTDAMQLVRIACGSEAFYHAMVEEYRRHFMFLLEGRLATPEEASQYTPCEEAGLIDEPLAIDIISRMAQNAYTEARKLCKQ